MNNHIIPIYSSPANEEKPFHFVDIDQMHWLTEEEVKSLLDFAKEKPKLTQFKNIVYTWDYFTWAKIEKKLNAITKSINKVGIGYCGACGKMTTLDNEESQWICRMCGYKNNNIYDQRHQRVNEKR